MPEPEKKIDNENQPQYTEALSKNTKRLPHPTDLAVFLCLKDNGGSIAGKYNTLMGIPSSRFLCMPESESRHPQSNVANLSKNTKELAMANIITAHYNGTEVFFQNDAFLNATAIAKHFNKSPRRWLELPSTIEYIELLSKKLNVGKSDILKTTRGVNGGTWLHRRLAVAFARWLNVDFAIWCDEQIENILIGQNKPQQLALPEPEPLICHLNIDEAVSLAWLWKAAEQCRELLEILYPALEKISSSYAGACRGQATEYVRTIEHGRKVVEKITDGITDRDHIAAYVLHGLRRHRIN
ncbi:KilA-N domain-containing protein [Testudinibacter sp. TR-2022]|uniref:KilA-N domain-containing protein n=1 Tax=Testudinibacter sp. TR-2022 TaxID=2585029 RepID=UPI003FA3C602